MSGRPVTKGYDVPGGINRHMSEVEDGRHDNR